MAFFDFIYRNGIWVSVPAFAAGAALLALSIVGVVRFINRSQIARLPLVAQQTVDFAEAGTVVLCLEGPRLSNRFSDLAFSLIAPDGTFVSGSTIWVHTTTAGFSTVTMDLLRFSIGQPGTYQLRIANLGAARDDDGRHTVIFGTPLFPLAIVYILGIIASAALTIGSIVLFALRLLANGDAP